MKGLLTTAYNPKKLVRQALMSCSTTFCRIGEVDAAVAVKAQEEGKGRDKRRRQEERERKNLPKFLVSKPNRQSFSQTGRVLAKPDRTGSSHIFVFSVVQ